MACGEHQPQQVVAERIVECVQVRVVGMLLFGFQFARDFLVLALLQLAAAQAIVAGLPFRFMAMVLSKVGCLPRGKSISARRGKASRNHGSAMARAPELSSITGAGRIVSLTI